MARRLSELGAQVVICSRKMDMLTKTAEEISAATGNPVYCVAADVRDPEAVRAAMDECEKFVGVPSIVINNGNGCSAYA
ncbi:SDR family NAD(P)-dependent oxidoreductase [archaeon]|nr:MAG: SDR family NAD(P)-dependent oxidoreductase [archaeon]